MSSSNVAIREADQADLPSIVRLLADDKLGREREIFAEPLPNSYQRSFDEISASGANKLLVAMTDNAVIGVLQLTIIPYLTFQGSRRALIEGVRVATEHRSRGIGRLMIKDAIRRAKDKGCHLIQLTTDKSRPEAKSFYESLGFVATHEGLKLSL